MDDQVMLMLLQLAEGLTPALANELARDANMSVTEVQESMSQFLLHDMAPLLEGGDAAGRRK